MNAVQRSESPGILCGGSIVLDTIVRPVEELRFGTTTLVETLDQHLGGNGANTARALAILGNRVRLLGAVGNDVAAVLCLDALAQTGVEIHALGKVDLPNAATVVLVHPSGDRQFLHRLGCSEEAFRAAPDFRQAFANGMRHFHLASLFVLPQLRAQAPELLRLARAAGFSTSLDTNWDARDEWLKVLGPCLTFTDVLFLNEDESRMLTGTSDTGAAAAFLQARGAAIVVQKLSKAGCAIYTGDREVAVRCEPFVVEAIDSTGAGDCFAAGFLSAFLAGGSLADAGMLGNAAGARSVSALGAVSGLLNWEELHLWMREARR